MFWNKQVYLAITNPGLGPFVRDELKELSDAILCESSLINGGTLFKVCLKEQDEERLRKIKSVHQIYRHFCTLDRVGSKWDLENILQSLESINYSFIKESSFRIKVKRRFKTAVEFKTVDIERRLTSRIEQLHGFKFDLRQPDLILYLELFENNGHFGIPIALKDLSKRNIGPYNFTNSIKANIAYAMCRMANVIDLEKGGLIVDPFCGSGTCLFEAYGVNPNLKMVAIDKSEHAVAGCFENFKNFKKIFPGSVNSYEVIRHDANHMDKIFEDKSVDVFIADPPFGRHMGKKIRFFRFYTLFLSQVRKLLKPGGILIIRVTKKEKFVAAVHGVKGLRVETLVEVDQGGFSSYLIKVVSAFEGP